MFALRLYRETAKRIAWAYRVELGKAGPIALAEDTLLLWAFD